MKARLLLSLFPNNWKHKDGNWGMWRDLITFFAILLYLVILVSRILARIDAKAKEAGTSRSAYIAQLILLRWLWLMAKLNWAKWPCKLFCANGFLRFRTYMSLQKLVRCLTSASWQVLLRINSLLWTLLHPDWATNYITYITYITCITCIFYAPLNPII